VIKMLNVEEIRKDFPILKNRKIIYLDNAATTHKPIQVINAITNFYTKHNANIHRGAHTLSQEASKMYEEAHEIIAKLINATPEEIVFTSGTTDSLNMIAQGLEHLINEGDEIITTIAEHHSNFLPWKKLAEKKRAKLKIIGIDEQARINLKQLEKEITNKTRIVAITHMSNVTGAITNIKKAAKIAHSQNAILVVDGAQSVPHIPVDVKQLEIDFLAFSGHKMLGPTGTGVLYGRKDILKQLEPPRLGGGTIEKVTLETTEFKKLPWKLEAGTPNIAGAIGLAEAAKYLMKIGMKEIMQHEKELTRKTLEQLKEIPEVKVVGPINPEEKGGIISFTVKNIHHHTIATLLDTYGIAVRSGKHCAHPLHQRLNLKGTVRASYYLYNTTEEIEILIQKLKEIIEFTT